MPDPGGVAWRRSRVSSVLIGRDDALALAARRWEGAKAGRGEFLLVAGEAGIGKTRFLAELVEQAGVASPRAAAYPREIAAAGAIIYNLADEFKRLGFVDAAARLRSRLLDEVATDASNGRRRMLLGDLAEILVDTISNEPMLLRFEDLHWADELSLDVLERVAATVPSTPSFIVGSYRSDELYIGTRLRSWRARLLEQRLGEEVRLTRLDHDGTAGLVEAITGTLPSSEFVESLLRRSDGIPLHIEELIAADADSAVLETVAEAVEARLARLDAPSQAIVSAASVIGRAFDLSLLGTITNAETADVATALKGASELHIVVPHDDGEYGFRHSIICDVTYDGIPADERASIHAAVARAATSAGFGDAFISEHFERAGESLSAHTHALSAAAEAERVSAHREAAELLARAVRTMPASTARDVAASVHARFAAALAASDDSETAAQQLELAIGIHRELGDVVRIAALTPQLVAARHLLGAPLPERVLLISEAMRELDAMQDGGPLRERVGLLGALSAAYMLDRRLPESIEHGELALDLAKEDLGEATIDIRLSVGSSLVFSGRGDEGWPMLEGAIREAESAGLERTASRGFRMLGSCASVLLEYPRARTWIDEGLEYTAKTECWNDHHYLASQLAHVDWATGHWDDADRRARQALADGRGITTRIVALTVIGYVALAQSRFADAGQALEEARGLGEHLGEVQRLSPALWGLAEVALHAGQFDEAAALGERAVVESERVGDAAYLFPFVVTGTRALVGARDIAAARDWVARCARTIDAVKLPGTEFAIEHALGLVAMAEGHTGVARSRLETAHAGWQQLDRRWEAVQSLIDLAECARRSRRPNETVELLHRASVLAEGSTLLEGLAAAVTMPSGGVGALSAREFEVARLIATGATNREIAAALTIAPKTASAHVEHILAKLGASRRAEIASWVATQAPTPAAPARP